MRLSLVEVSPMIREYILRHIGVLVNKFMPATKLSNATDLLWTPSMGLMQKDNLSDNSIRVFFWIAKALVLRLTMVDEVLKQLLDLLANLSLGNAAARGFGLLLAPDELLSKENGATIRLLAKQKTFSICVPFIATKIKEAQAATKSNYLIALSGILRYSSTEILMTSVGILLPLLLQSLDLVEQDIQIATIETLTTLSQESPGAIEEQISSLVNRLLKRAAEARTQVPVCYRLPHWA